MTHTEDKAIVELGKRIAYMLYNWRYPSVVGTRIDFLERPDQEQSAAWDKAAEILTMVNGTDLKAAGERVKQAARDHIRAILRDQSLDEKHEFALRSSMRQACNCSTKRQSLDEVHAAECPSKPFVDIWKSLLHGM
jgi:Na+-transporting NADH:ubiquinone oxidoreductase subunit NqrC